MIDTLINPMTTLCFIALICVIIYCITKYIMFPAIVIGEIKRLFK